MPSSSLFLFKIVVQTQKMKNRDLCTQKKNETRFCMHTRVAEIFTRKSLQNEFMTNDSFMRCDFSFYSVKIRNGLFSRLYFGMCDMCCHVFIKRNAKKNLLFSADLFLFTFKSYHDDIMLS